MATFIEAHNNEGNETKIEIDADEVEEGILKQLFYKVEHKKSPKVDIENFSQFIL